MEKSVIRNFVLANAVKYDGKASQGSVIGQLVASDSSVKSRLKELGKEIAAIIKEINSMSVAEQTAELKKNAPELLAPKEKVEKKRELPELEGAEQGKVVTRFPPEPSKHLHIGHAITLLVNEMEARKHEGTFILRFDDTNPEKCAQEYVDAAREDIGWLGVTVDKEAYASDYMEEYYASAATLIEQNDAYVCFCTSEVMRDLRFKSIPCACKDASVQEHLANWQKMLDSTHEPGKCVLRLVGDMANPNGTLRDPVIMRIVYKPHFRTGEKYAVWPTYDFENPLAEELTGVTHILRSAEFDQRIDLQDLIRQKLGLGKKSVVTFGRMNIIGATTKGREIREKIDSGEYMGWDDPRLMTLKALRRRGIRPDALRELVFELGLGKGTARVDWSIIAALNRKLVDADTDRLFFVPAPQQISVEGAPEQTIELAKHPDHPERGVRTLQTSTDFLIQEKDLALLKEGELYRLMECLNFRKAGVKFAFDSADLETYKKKGKRILHWLPLEGNLKADVTMDDASIVTGVVEPGASELQPGTLVQLERYGFCVLDRVKGDTYHFWFTHK